MLDYSPYTWHDGDTGGTLVTAARLNALELGLQDASVSAHAAQAATVPELWAPAPSGGDDTTVLQNLLTTAQSTGGTVNLRPGTYKVTNLTTSQSFNQPRIVGAGKKYTLIQGTGTAGTPIIKLKGGSGQYSGGYLADLTITAGSGQVGLELQGVGGVRWTRIEFAGALAEGIRFHNFSAGEFTEFNHGDAIFASAVILPARYMRTSGNESFHGSGFTQGTVFQRPTGVTGPAINIDAGCFPYQAPLTAAFFTSSAAPLIRNQNTSANRDAHFVGAVTVEAFTSGTVLVDSSTTNGVNLTGTVSALGSTTFDVGDLTYADYVYYSDTGVAVRRKTFTVGVPATSTSFGRVGSIAYDANFAYFCVADNTWKRVALAAW